MFEKNYLVVLTNREIQIFIQYVSSVNERLAIKKAEALGNWEEVLIDDEVLEYFEDIYPNDIQAVTI
tara:strand:- start:6 stop:206 length:201 start_codon:yes stop_codon:yes gene_type:complete